MFTKRTLLTFASSLAIALIVGSVVQQGLKHGTYGRLKSAADDLGDQYSDGNTNRVKEASMYMAASNKKVTEYLPNYLQSAYTKNLGSGLVGKEEIYRQISGQQGPMYADNEKAPILGLRKDAYYNNEAPQSMHGPMLQAQAMPISGSGGAAPYESMGGVGGPIINERKIITNEEITLEVPDAEKAQNQLDGLVSRYDGIVLNFNINKLTDGSRGGLFVFKVLPKDLKDVLREVRRLGEVQAENQSGEDITNQYDYMQSRLLNYQKVKGQLDKVLAKNANNVDNNLNIQAQLASVQSNIDSLASSIRQYDDQSYMATVVVNFYDTVKTMTAKPLSFKDKFFKTVKDNLKSTLQTTYELAINSFSGIFIIMSFLFQILLWSLAIWGIYQLIKWMIKK